MAVTVLVNFVAKPEANDQLMAMMKDALPHTREYDGCLGVEAVNNLDRNGDLVLIEKWETREKYDAYMAWRVETGMIDAVGPMLEGEPSIKYYETVDI